MHSFRSACRLAAKVVSGIMDYKSMIDELVTSTCLPHVFFVKLISQLLSAYLEM